MTTHIASLYAHCMGAVIQILCGSRQEHSFSILVKQLKKEYGLVPVFTYLIIEELIKCYPGYVEDDVLQLISYKNIKSLVVKGCVNVTCQSLGVVLQRCTNIRSLDLSECDQLMRGDELVNILRGYGKCLRTLRLDKVSTLDDDLLQNILHYCPSLEELWCEGCVGLQDSSFLKPTGGHPSFGDHLTVVNVSCCENVTNTFVRHLAEVTGPRLRSVNISWTNADCISLLYLAGYTLSTAVEVAHSSRSLEVHVIKDIELAKVLEEEKNKRSKNFQITEDTENEIPSDVVKGLCDYCVGEAVRLYEEKSSDNGTTIEEESFGDYDVIKLDTEMPPVIEIISDSICPDWAILSLDDISVGVKPGSCSCQQHQRTPGAVNFTEKISAVSDENTKQPSDATSPHGMEADQYKRLFIPCITTLNVTDIRFFEFAVGKRCVELFVESNPNLLDLHMSWEEMSNEVLEHIARNEVNLQNISLVNCEKVTGDGISTLAVHCKHLKRVDIKGMSFLNDASLIKIIENNPTIQYFCLAESPLTDCVLSKLSEALHHTIRHLDLSWCENITNVGVVNVLSRCEKLSYLNLRQCKVAFPTIRAITRYGGTLTDIGLCGIGGLDDKTCQAMLKGLPNLRCVDLSWSACITDSTVEVMLNVCPQLRLVAIVGLKLITTKALLPIIPRYNEWYESRGINPDCMNGSSGKEGIKEDDALHIPFRSVDYASELEVLSLGYCDKVNDDHLSEIVAVCRGTLIIQGYYGEAIKPKWQNTRTTRQYELPVTSL